MTSFTKEIIPRYTAGQMEQAYNAAIEDIKEGYKLVFRAEKTLLSVFGNFNRHGTFRTTPTNGNYHRDEEMVTEIIKEITKGAWWTILNSLEIEKISSKKRYEEITKNLEEGTLPPVTITSIYDILQSFVQNQDEIAKELMKEVYDELYPRNNRPHYRKPVYATNLKHLKGYPRVILTRVVEHRSDGGFQVYSYHQEGSLLRIDRAFALLDGTGLPDGYRGPLGDAINTTDDTGVGETNYFKFKCCQNGNLHLFFKRPDLLAELVRLAGGNELHV